MRTRLHISPPALALFGFCLLITVIFLAMIDLKPISTDEGLRLAIINGGMQRSPQGIPQEATWDKVITTCSPYAYQPLYFLLQNSLMRFAGTQSLVFFRLVNIGFLLLCLCGIISLSQGWGLSSRLLVLALFSGNAFLQMHVLQIREYIVGLAIYIWGSWLVLRLEQRSLSRPWRDAAWFTGYGLLLLVGFFVQSWTVFPAIGQGIFLLIRRRQQRLRFFSLLALSYVTAVTVVSPYLYTHQQKINVGHWATESESLLSHISQGFHLVLGGQPAGASACSDALSWLWLAVIVCGLFLFLRRENVPHTCTPGAAETRRQALLMMLSIAVALAFQIAYAIKVENLSLWPRYFIIHYFFSIWLIALAAQRLRSLEAAESLSLTKRRIAGVIFGLLLLAGGFSAVYQTRSYWRDPWFDTSQSPADNWYGITADLSRWIEPDDAVLTQDFVVRSTLSFTHPLPNRLLVPSDLPKADLHALRRVVYIESTYLAGRRPEVAASLAAAGFLIVKERPIPGADGSGPIGSWRYVVFRRE